jgi:hypothetical protein
MTTSNKPEPFRMLKTILRMPILTHFAFVAASLFLGVMVVLILPALRPASFYIWMAIYVALCVWYARRRTRRS